MRYWDVGAEDHTTTKFSNPSYVIPSDLKDRYVQVAGTTMPAGPYVNWYTIETKVGERKDPLGQYPIQVYLNVQWNPSIMDLINARQKLLGSEQQIADIYHSRSSQGFNILCLNELQRKINRTISGHEYLLNHLAHMNPSQRKRWDDFIYNIHLKIKQELTFDPAIFTQYVKTHSTSSVIPRTADYKSRKWGQLQSEEIRRLYDMDCYFFEHLIKDWDVLRARIVSPKYPGRGLRARPNEVKGITSQYYWSVNRARQVNFLPYLSSENAFLRHETMDSIYREFSETFHQLTGVELLYPPLVKGSYWTKLSDAIDSGDSFLAADGANQETWTTYSTKMYIYAVDDGIPQMLSGFWGTSLFNSIANAMFVTASINRHKIDTGSLRYIGILGDDFCTVGKPHAVQKFQFIPDVWEQDEEGTRLRCALGVMMLGKGFATFPGAYRITIERAELAIPIRLGPHKNLATGQMEKIEPIMPPDAKLLYHEILAHGTLHDKPLLDVIGEITLPTFWDAWARDRVQLVSEGNVGNAKLGVPPESTAEEDVLTVVE